MHGYYYASLVQEFAGLKEEEFYIDPPTAAISSSTLGKAHFTHKCRNSGTYAIHAGIDDLGHHAKIELYTPVY